MKVCIFVNDVETEDPRYTTTRLAMEAVRRGHEVWYSGAGDFTFGSDDALRVHAWQPPSDAADPEEFLAGAEEGERPSVVLDEFDVLLIRNDPADDVPDRPWAQTAGPLFGELAAERGVVVLNDPAGLWRASTKLYVERLPRSVRPETVITRNEEDVRAFVEAHGGRVVLKPIQGSGGDGVFIVQPEGDVNIAQMVDALARDGYLAVQELLPEAAQGDTRLFVLDGYPLEVDGVYAAFRRVPAEDEARSNMNVGGRAEPVSIGDDVLRVVEVVRPQLIEDGMFLVGLDLVGDRILEVNVFSPGGLGSVEGLTGVDFGPVVIDAVEAKVREARRPRSAAG